MAISKVLKYNLMPKELIEYLKHDNCYNCALAKWEFCSWYCPLLKEWFDDDGKVRTTKRIDCPIKRWRADRNYWKENKDERT